MRGRAAFAVILLATAAPPALPREKPLALRVMTYNIHSCRGRDEKIRPDRIAQVIAEHKPDVVALQEVRVGRVESAPAPLDSSEKGAVMPPVGEYPLPPPEAIPPRTPANTAAAAPFTDQPRAIAEALGMGYVFYPLVRLSGEDYGIAVLSRYPLRIVRAENLPTHPEREGLDRTLR